MDQTTRLQDLAKTLNPDRPTSVVDIGANPLDSPPYTPLLKAKVCHVFGFEPQETAFEALQKSKSDRETYFPFPVGDGNPVEFHIYRQSGLSSTFTIDESARAFLGRPQRGSRLVETIQMDTKRVDDIEDLKQIDLLKIDVQGSEVEIFKNASNKLSTAVGVVTELRFHRLYEDEPLLDAQIAELSKLGFIFHKVLFIKSAMISNSQTERLRRRSLRNQAIDGDAVFIRDISKPDQVTSEQLKHLAIMADGVFESYDLAIKCLDLLVERGELDTNFPKIYVDGLPDAVKKF